MPATYTTQQLDTCYRQLSNDRGDFYRFWEEDFPKDLVFAAMRRHGRQYVALQPVASMPGYLKISSERPATCKWFFGLLTSGHLTIKKRA